MFANGPGYTVGGANGDPAASSQAKSEGVEPRLKIVR